MKAVACELVSGDVIPDVAALCSPVEEVSEHAVELLLRLGDLAVPMQEGGELTVGMPVTFVADERIGRENGFETVAGPATSVSDFDEVFDVFRDLSLVPGEEDCFDVRKVLIERRTSDAGRLGDLRHSHRQEPMLGHERHGRIQDCVADRRTVRLDCLAPQLRHHHRIHDVRYSDTTH